MSCDALAHGLVQFVTQQYIPTSCEYGKILWPNRSIGHICANSPKELIKL